MNKILIGSIISVCVLIGISFTSVVGYRSVASDVNASPLFNIRTIRAIDEESGDLTYDYLGNGEDINIIIPKRNAKRELILRAFERIIKMNKKELYKMTDFILNNINNDNLNFQNQINEELIQEIFIEYGIINDENPIITEAICFTGQQCTIFPDWDFLQCLPVFILALPFIIVAISIIAVAGVITFFIAIITFILFAISIIITVQPPMCEYHQICEIL